MNDERMKLPKFLKEVDALSKNLSHENMEMLIHEIARTWPENRRNDLLQLMRSYENISGGKSCKKCIDDGISQIVTDIESIIYLYWRYLRKEIIAIMMAPLYICVGWINIIY